MIKHIMAITVMWFIFALLSPLYGQQRQKESTLNNLWLKVEASYPGVGAKASAVDAAKLNELAVKSGMLPQVKAQAQNTYGTYQGSSGAFFPQPGFFNVSGPANSLNGSSSMAANSFGSATVEWQLFSFGKLRKENQAANKLVLKTVSEKNAYLLGLKKTLSERYITLLYNDAKLSWTQKNAERLDSIRHITSGLSRAGLRPAADSLLASSSYVQARGEQDKWNGLKIASLIKLLELYAGDTVDYSASIVRFNNPLGNSFIQENNINPSHPLLDALDQQAQYYTHSGEAQKRAALPTLSLLGGYGYRGTGISAEGVVSGAWKDGFNHAANNYLVGIGMTWNITGLRTNYLKGEKLFKDAESTKLLHSQYEHAMVADLSASQAKIFEQSHQLQKTRLAVTESQDAYNMYLARYKSGLITLTELLQVRILLEQAENNHIAASYDYWMLFAYQAELTANFDFLFNNL